MNIKTNENLNIKKSIQLIDFKEHLKNYEPNFAKKVKITIDGKKWSIHRLESVKKIKCDTLSYFVFYSNKRGLEETIFFSISSRTGIISHVPCFNQKKSDCEPGELFLLLDGTGIFTYVIKNNNIKFKDAAIEYELGMCKYLWEVCDLIFKHFGKTT